MTESQEQELQSTQTGGNRYGYFWKGTVIYWHQPMQPPF